MSVYTRYDVENEMNDIIWCLECNYLAISKNWIKYTLQDLFPEPFPENSRVDLFS